MLSVHAQRLHLKITTKDSTNSHVLEQLAFKKLHKNELSLSEEKNKISNQINLFGYINHTTNLYKKDSVYHYIFTLNKKIDSITIFYKKGLLSKKLVGKISTKFNNTSFKISIDKIEPALNSIVHYFESRGASFTSTSLINLKQNKNIIEATLKLEVSKKRKIDRVIVKGYDEFPEKFLDHYLDLKKLTIFNLNTLQKINEELNKLPFITQIKKPSVLFTKDSTTLFIYLKKQNTNKFDGLIGITNSTSQKKIRFNGYLNLFLNNTLNKGESFSIHWNNNGLNTETLKLTYNAPYIFNSRFNLFSDFEILKQDTIYNTTNTDFKLNYQINKNHSFSILYNNVQSNLTRLNMPLENISNFSKNIFGISYLLKSNNLNTIIEYSTGTRKTSTKSENQYKVHFLANQKFILNHKKSIHIKIAGALLESSQFLENELFRLGGVNTMRGFDEQSIFASKYAYSNIEYHYKVNNSTDIYTITDFGLFNNPIIDTKSKLFSFGIGYYFKINNTITNLNYAVGKRANHSLDLNNSKIHIKIIYLF